jgi:hypothetical protein
MLLRATANRSVVPTAVAEQIKKVTPTLMVLAKSAFVAEQRFWICIRAHGGDDVDHPAAASNNG